MKTQKAVSTVSTPAKKQAVALKDLKTKKDPKGGDMSGPFSQSLSNIEDDIICPKPGGSPITFSSKTGKNQL